MHTKPLSEQEQAVQDYVTRECGTAYTVTYTGEQTRYNDWKCDSWHFTIKGQSFEYYTGTGHRKTGTAITPPIAGLLYSIIIDGSSADSTFEDWCSDFGYDTDSRKALETYLACQQNATKFRKIFTAEQREKLQELLQDY